MNHKKILIIQTAFIGDAILTSPMIRELRRLFPDAQIDLIANPGTVGIFEVNPHINHVYAFLKKPFYNKIVQFFRLLFLIWREKYDCAISAQSYMTSANLMYFGRIPRRVGFKRQKLLTDPIDHGGLMHRSEYYLSLLQAFSDEKFDRQTEMYWSKQDGKNAAKLIEKTEKSSFLLGIAPGSVWFTKRWLKEHFVTLISQLGMESITVFLIGGPQEKKLCDEIERDAGNNNVINIAGQLSLNASAALIDKLDLMLVNDSAPLHIANAVQTDAIAIFGPTVQRFGFYPIGKNDTLMELDLECRPCKRHGGNSCPLKHFKCMRDIIPEMVLEVIRGYLKRKVMT